MLLKLALIISIVGIILLSFADFPEKKETYSCPISLQEGKVNNNLSGDFIMKVTGAKVYNYTFIPIKND